MALELEVSLPSIPSVVLCIRVEADARTPQFEVSDELDAPDASTLLAKLAAAQPGRHGNVRHCWKYVLSKLVPVAASIGRRKLNADEAAAAAAEACTKALQLYLARYPHWLSESGEEAAGSGAATAATTLAASRHRRIFVLSERVLLDDAVTMATAAATGTTTPARGIGHSAAAGSAASCAVGRPAAAAAPADVTIPLSPLGTTPRIPLPTEDDEEAAAARRAARSVVSRELLAARSVRTGGRGFIRFGDSLEQRKQRLALVLLAMEHEDMHSPLSVAGNEFCQGPFYAPKPG